MTRPRWWMLCLPLVVVAACSDDTPAAGGDAQADGVADAPATDGAADDVAPSLDLPPGVDAPPGVDVPPGADAPPADGPPVACAGSQIRCGGACVDPSTNTSHCGGCGQSCGTGAPAPPAAAPARRAR